MSVSSTRIHRRYPLDLGECMAVCDANYIRLLKLLPHLRIDCTREIWLDSPPGNTPHGSHADNAAHHVVRMRVIDSQRYTTTLCISLLPPSPGDLYFRPPAMLVRLYHDADTAEVLRYQEHSGFHLGGKYWGRPGFSVDEKQQVNAFLGEWLVLCMEQGMGSSPAEAVVMSED